MTKHLQAAGYLRAGPMAHSPLHTEHLLKGWKEQGSVSADRTKWMNEQRDGRMEGQEHWTISKSKIRFSLSTKTILMITINS